MERIEDDNFCLFEQMWLNKLNKKMEFENLSEEDISKRIESVKRNCFILELQNEVLEKYLKRRNPGVIRELDGFLKSMEFQKSSLQSVDAIQENENMNFEPEENSSSEVIERETMTALIEIVNQEIAEMCMTSKIRRRKHEKEIELLACDFESFKCQADYLLSVINDIDKQFPSEPKSSLRDDNIKMQGFIRFFEEFIKKMKIQIRKTTLCVQSLKRERSLLSKCYAENDSPVILAEVKLLEIHIEKISNELHKDRQVFLDLKFLFDNYAMKLRHELQKCNSMKMRITELNESINKMDRRLRSINKYYCLLLGEIQAMESKKTKLKELSSSSAVVLSPNEYIEQKAAHDKTLKKLKSLQRNVNQTSLHKLFKNSLSIEL